MPKKGLKNEYENITVLEGVQVLISFSPIPVALQKLEFLAPHT